MPQRELLALDHARPRDQRELTFELHALATGVPDGTVISGCCCAGGAETPLRTLCSSAALTNPEKSGCGWNGFDWNSGWYWQPMKYGCPSSSMTSTSPSCSLTPEATRPRSSKRALYSLFTSYRWRWRSEISDLPYSLWARVPPFNVQSYA